MAREDETQKVWKVGPAVLTTDRVLQTVGGICLAVIAFLCINALNKIEALDSKVQTQEGRIIRVEAAAISEADKLKGIGERMDKGFGELKSDLKDLGRKVDRLAERSGP